MKAKDQTTDTTILGSVIFQLQTQTTVYFKYHLDPQFISEIHVQKSSQAKPSSPMLQVSYFSEKKRACKLSEIACQQQPFSRYKATQKLKGCKRALDTHIVWNMSEMTRGNHSRVAVPCVMAWLTQRKWACDCHSAQLPV